MISERSEPLVMLFMPICDLATDIGRQLHFAALAGLEAYRGAAWNIEMHAEGRGAVKRHRPVALGDVVMRADLDRPVASVDQHQFQRAAAGIDFDLALGEVDHAAFGGLADIEGFRCYHRGG